MKKRNLSNCSQVRLARFISLLERGADFSQTFCSDTDLFVPSKSIPIDVGSFVKGKRTKSCRGFRSSKTYENSTTNNGKVLSTSSAADFLVNLIPSQAKRKAKKIIATYGRTLSESFEKWDHQSRSWKTYRGFFPTTISAKFSEAWRNAGTMRNGMLYRRHPWALRTLGNDFGYLPTVMSGHHGLDGGARARKKLQLLSTPSSVNGLRGGQGSDHFPLKWGKPGNQEYGFLNPVFVEWMMGWPTEWTALQPLEMVKFRKWLRLHFDCSATVRE